MSTNVINYYYHKKSAKKIIRNIRKKCNDFVYKEKIEFMYFSTEKMYQWGVTVRNAVLYIMFYNVVQSDQIHNTDDR